MTKVNYDCTTAKMAEQIGISLWQAIEMGKWWKLRVMKMLPKYKIEYKTARNMVSYGYNQAIGEMRERIK